MIVQHPSFPNVRQDVPEADVEAWVASGWLLPDAPKKGKGKKEDGSDA